MDQSNPIQHPARCPNCKKNTFAFEKYCHHCGHNRWSS